MRYVTAFVILFVAVAAIAIGLGYVGKTAVRDSEAAAFVEKGLHDLKVTTFKGDKGDTGLRGLTGPKGDKGDRGLTGDDGLPGIDGLNGRDGNDAVCVGGCCHAWCMPVPAPKPATTGLVFTQSFHSNPASGGSVTITVNGVPQTR